MCERGNDCSTGLCFVLSVEVLEASEELNPSDSGLVRAGAELCSRMWKWLLLSFSMCENCITLYNFLINASVVTVECFSPS